MYTQANAPMVPSYSNTAAATGSIIFLALLACAIAASLYARRSHPRAGASSLMMAASTVAAPVTALARRVRSRHAAEELDRETVEAWFEAPSLAGFPAEALQAMLPEIDQAERPRLQTAWLLATHGHDAAWLTGHFGLSPDVARLLADSAHQVPALKR